MGLERIDIMSKGLFKGKMIDDITLINGGTLDQFKSSMKDSYLGDSYVCGYYIGGYIVSDFMAVNDEYTSLEWWVPVKKESVEPYTKKDTTTKVHNKVLNVGYESKNGQYTFNDGMSLEDMYQAIKDFKDSTVSAITLKDNLLGTIYVNKDSIHDMYIEGDYDE